MHSVRENVGRSEFQVLQDQTTYILTYNHQDESTRTLVYCDIQDLLPSLTQTIIILCSLKWSVRAFEGPFPAPSTPMMPDSYPATFELSSSYLPFKWHPLLSSSSYCSILLWSILRYHHSHQDQDSYSLLCPHLGKKCAGEELSLRRLDRPTTKPYAMGCAKPFDPTAVLC
jgi:hypothetical protein